MKMKAEQTLVHTRIYLFAVRVVEHAVHDVLGQFGLVGVSSSAHPRVNDALIVCALKRYLQKTHTHKSSLNLRTSRSRQWGEIPGGTNCFIVIMVR